MLHRLICRLLLIVVASIPGATLASTQNVTPATVFWTFHHGNGISDTYPSAIVGCQASIAGSGAHGAYLGWDYSNFDGEFLSLCRGYGTDANGGQYPVNGGYIYPYGTCPAGTTGPHSISAGVAACTVSCADGDAYNSIAGACSSVIDKSFYAPCPVCFGDPIYPLNGAKRQTVDLGLSIGGLPVTIAYDSTVLVPQTDYNVPFEVAPPSSFGRLWQTNLHKSLALQPSTAASGAQVGSQWSAVAMQRGSAALETASVAGSTDCSTPGTGGNAYVPTVNVTEKLTLTGSGSAGTLVDQRALTEEVYDTAGAIASLSRASGGKLTFGYTTGLLTSVTDQFGRTVQFGYEQPSDPTLRERPVIPPCFTAIAA